MVLSYVVLCLSYSDYYGAYNRWLLFDSRVFWFPVFWFTGRVSRVMSSCHRPRRLCDASSVWRYRGSDDDRRWWMRVKENSVCRVNGRCVRVCVTIVDSENIVCMSQRLLCASRRPHFVLPWRVCSRFSRVCLLFSWFLCIRVFELNRVIWECIWLKAQFLIRALGYCYSEDNYWGQKRWLHRLKNAYCIILYICI